MTPGYEKKVDLEPNSDEKQAERKKERTKDVWRRKNIKSEKEREKVRKAFIPHVKNKGHRTYLSRKKQWKVRKKERKKKKENLIFAPGHAEEVDLEPDPDEEQVGQHDRDREPHPTVNIQFVQLIDTNWIVKKTNKKK